MKKNVFKRTVSALLAAVMIILVMPIGVVSFSAASTAVAENDYSVPTTGHKLLSSYNAISGTDISTEGAATSLNIFNRDKLDELIKNYASYDPRHGQIGEERRGNSMTSFAINAGFSISSSVGANVGIDKLFKISAEKKFKLSGEASYSQALETYFYEYAITVQKGYYNFNQAYLEEVRDFSNGYLDQAFINALTGADGTSAEEFFDIYGTHLITSYTAGGVSGVCSSTIKKSQSFGASLDTLYSESAGASVSYQGIQAGGEAALEIQASIEGKYKTDECLTHSKTYAYGGNNAVCFKNDGTFDYTGWVNSIDSENAVILIDNHLKLVPIWSLLPSVGYEDRALELLTYFVDKMEEQDSQFYGEFGIDESVFDYSKDWVNFENCKIITNEEELNAIRNDLDGVYVLANNIVLSDYANWTPIGTKEEPFVGRLYGNYNTISGLNVSATPSDDPNETTLVGLFGCNDGLITDVKISGNIAVPETDSANVYIGAVAAYNKGIVNNCCDEVKYDIDYSSVDKFVFPIESQIVESDKTYCINNELGIYLVGEEETAYSNVNIVIEGCNNVGPVFVIIENVNMTGSSLDGTIDNKTARPVYIISRGTQNTIYGCSGKPGAPAVNSANSDVSIFGNASIYLYGGNGSAGTAGKNANNYGGNGGDGGDGACAVAAKTLTIDVSEAALYGGNGGNGGKGGTGKFDWGDGHGGNGGKGGDGGAAIQSEIVCYINGVIHAIGGNGGKGGNGGTGENYMLDWGHGGNGGKGGNAGSAAIYNDIINRSSAKVYQISGDAGAGGSGGNGEGSSETDGAAGSAGAAVVPKVTICAGEKVYALCETTKNWNDAKASAEANGAYLVTITSEDEQSIINELLSYGNLYDYYIGAYRTPENVNVWAWVTGEEFSYTNWYAGEPNNSGGSEYHAGIYKETLMWNDYINSARGYIEEYDLISDGEDVAGYLSGVTVGYNADDGKIRNNHSSAWNDIVIQIDYVSKTEYFSGDVFDVSSAEIYMYGKHISGYGKIFDSSFQETSLARMGFVEITKDEYSRYIPVHITKTVPEYIEIVTPGKTEFAVGAEFNISGLSVKAVYNNGSQKYLDNDQISHTVPSTEFASQTEEVVITYQESGLTFQTSYTITTVIDTIESIFIQTPAITLVYKQGDELDLTGLQIYESRKSGEKVLIDNQYLVFDVFPSLCNVGESTVTIKHPSNAAIFATYTIRVQAAAGFEHLWDAGTVTIEPTHVLTGEKTYHCTVANCNATKTESIPMLEGHNYGDWHKLNDEQHQRVCECGDTIMFDHAWNEGVITIPATHMSAGESLHICSVCNATETRVVEKFAEHEFDSWVKHDDGQHSRACECGEVDYANHSWGAGTATVEPTYTTEGLMTYTCADCHATMTETIPVLQIPEDAPYLVVDTKNAVVGGTVSVKIKLVNNPGITSMRFNVAYDSEMLTLTAIEYNTEMGGQSILPENIEALDGSVVLYWVNGMSDYEGDGLFVTLTFEVSEDATVGAVSTISVTYDEEDIYDANEDNVTFWCTDGVLTFLVYVPGDVNGDGVLNSKDTTRLMRYLAGWDVDVNEAALDVNGDGVVNTKDTTRLMRYLAGWNVEIN